MLPETVHDRRRLALSSDDYATYALLTDQGGFEPEDPVAYEQGQMLLEFKRFGTASEQSAFDFSDNDHFQVSNLPKLLDIALSVPAPLFHGEKRTRREYKNQLARLRKFGYDVPAYSKMTLEALKNCFTRAKEDIITAARANCPNELRSSFARKKDIKFWNYWAV
jgi:hypothetical protein